MTFDFKRFTTLLVTELRANPKQYLGAPLIALAVILGIVLWQVINNALGHLILNFYDISATLSILAWFGFGLAICVINAGAMFSNMKTRALRINTLMLPASPLEKYMVRWVLFVPLSIVVFYAGIFAIDLLQYLISFLAAPNGWHHLVSWDQIFRFSLPFMCILLMIQSDFCLGSSIWPKNSVLHTILWLMALNFITSMVFTALLFMMDSSTKIPVFFSDYVWPLLINDDSIEILLSDKLMILSKAALILTTIIVCGINYTLAYFRFKENEIIDRW